MKPFLTLSRWVDRLNDGFGGIAQWTVLASCFISAGNAAVRYSFDVSSNAYLEIQWYLFAAGVMLGVSQVLRLNEHVRVDVLYGRYPPRVQGWVDLLGLIFFLMPVCVVVVYLSWPIFMNMYRTGEMSPSAGGLIRWPVMLLIPMGFFLLILQGLSEIIKRVAWLRGLIEMDTHYERPLQ